MAAEAAPGGDPVSTLVRLYHTAFPAADVDAFGAHLAIVNAGAEIAQALGRYLMSRYGINHARYALLRALYFADDKRLPQNEVARAMNVSSPNVTQLMDALERDGLVERVDSESDRRVTFAQLTPEGEAKCAELVPAMARFMEDTCRPFSTEDKKQLMALLARFRENLSRSMEGEAWPRASGASAPASDLIVSNRAVSTRL